MKVEKTTSYLHKVFSDNMLHSHDLLYDGRFWASVASVALLTLIIVLAAATREV